jgi:hypothetical protein
MAFDLGGFFGGANFFGIFSTLKWSVIGIIILSMCAGIIYFLVYKKLKYNLRVEVKIPRSDGALLTAEWAKGSYNIKRGTVYIKRKRMKPIVMKPFNTRQYLQGEDILTVVQVSPSVYIPVMPKTYLHLIDDKTGKEAAIFKLKADWSSDKVWAVQEERSAKETYTIKNILRDYLPYIGFSMVLLSIFAGFTIIYAKVT